MAWLAGWVSAIYSAFWVLRCTSVLAQTEKRVYPDGGHMPMLTSDVGSKVKLCVRTRRNAEPRLLTGSSREKAWLRETIYNLSGTLIKHEPSLDHRCTRLYISTLASFPGRRKKTDSLRETHSEIHSLGDSLTQ